MSSILSTTVSMLTWPKLGYTHREVWSIGFAVIGLLWPLLWPKKAAAENWKLLLAWVGVCLGTAVFPLLSVDKQETMPLMYVLFCAIVVIDIAYYFSVFLEVLGC